jgi:hypothetical protein
MRLGVAEPVFKEKSQPQAVTKTTHKKTAYEWERQQKTIRQP